MLLDLIEKWLKEHHPGFRLFKSVQFRGLVADLYGYRAVLRQPSGTANVELAVHINYPGRLESTRYKMSVVDPDFFDRLNTILCEARELGRKID